MGIKQPTDPSLQAILGKGADQICMHLRSCTYTQMHVRIHARTQAKTGTNTYTHRTHTPPESTQLS